MALSQKFPGLMVVPWYNSDEWHYVKNCIVKDDAKKLEALNILRIWKKRTDKLPSGVEGTLMLLEVLVSDGEIRSSRDRFSCYCFALLRFLNICCGHGDKQATFYCTAKKNNFPDWIIDLRHALAHGISLPGEQAVHDALVSCLEWVIEEYWNKQGRILKNYVKENPIKAVSVADLYCNITLNSFLNKKASTIKDLVLVNNTLHKKFSNVKQKSLIDLSIQEGRESLLNTLKSILNENELRDVTRLVAKYLYSELPDLTEIDKIPLELRMLWKNLINLYYDGDILLNLIWELLNKCNSSELSVESQKLASLWLEVIFKKLIDLKKETEANNKESENENLYRIVRKCDMFATAAKSNFNLFTSFYLYRILELQGQSEITEKEITDEKKHVTFTQSTTDEDNIYFNICGSDADNIMDDKGQDVLQTTMDDSTCNMKEVTFPKITSHCVLLTDTSMFENCPLGVLPNNQCRDYNPLIEFNY